MRPPVLLLAATLAAGCTRADEPRPDPAPAPPAAAPRPAPREAEPPARAPAPPPPPPDRAARRCRLHGDPLGSGCSLGGAIATDRQGRLYVVDDAAVRRYAPRVDEAGCELALDEAFAGGALALPAIAPRPQVLGEGPVYMQSGGPQWRVAAAPDGAVYLFEFLRGVHRVDQGTVVPVCPDLQGVGALAITSRRAVIARGGGEQVQLARGCKRSPARLDPPAGRAVHAAGDALYAEQGGGLVRYGADGRAAARLGADDAFAPGGLCSVTGVAACGAGGRDVCVLDNNCKKLARFAPDGALVGELDGRALFAESPYGLPALAPAADGGAWILASHRDGKACEGAIYHVPGATLDGLAGVSAGGEAR